MQFDADGFTDLQPRFTDRHFDAVLSLVAALLEVERQLNAWQASLVTSWHSVVGLGRDHKPRRRLKSELC